MSFVVKCIVTDLEGGTLFFVRSAAAQASVYRYLFADFADHPKKI